MLTKDQLLERFTSLAKRYRLTTHGICEIVGAVNGIIREARINADDLHELDLIETVLEQDDLSLEERWHFVQLLNERLASIAMLERNPLKQK